MALPVIRFEAFLAGAWVDLTARVLHEQASGGQTVEVSTGRQNELDDPEPSRLSLALRNDDGALIPGNPLSPYPDWRQGCPVRLTEIVNGTDVRLFTGTLQIPDVVIALPGVDQPAAAAAVDILGRLGNAPPFEGVLHAHIATQGGGTLVDHWPLSEDSRPVMSAITGAEGVVRVLGFFDDPVPAEPLELLKAAETDGPPGDDRKYALFAPIGDSEGDALIGQAQIDAPVNVPVATNEVIAVSCWYRASPWATVAGATQPGAAPIALSAGGDLQIILFDDTTDPSTEGLYAYVLNTVAATQLILPAGRVFERSAWRLITVRVDTSTRQIDLWCGADLAVSGTHPGPLTGPWTFTRMLLGQNQAGALGHVQIRVGDTTTFTRADHLAQHRHGFTGLERQTVAERVATLAEYAGLNPAVDVDMPSTASALLQPAALAGVKAVDAMLVAAKTGGDTLVTNPYGKITVIPRAGRYNQATAMTIPYGWIDLGLAYRQDQAINNVTATVTGAGTVRRKDLTSIADVGYWSTSFDLATDVPADAGNLAAWTLRTYVIQRVRCPKLRINFAQRTAAEQAQLLAIPLGARITISGRPATAPADAGDLIVQGIKHQISADSRYLEFNTSPMLGATVGTPPACATVGGSVVGASTLIAY